VGLEFNGSAASTFRMSAAVSTDIIPENINKITSFKTSPLNFKVSEVEKFDL
jgi:hypothetical protein